MTPAISISRAQPTHVLAWKTWAFVHQSGAFWSTVHVHKGSKTQMMSDHDIAAGNGWQANTLTVSSCPLLCGLGFVAQIPRPPPGRDSFLLLSFFVPLASGAPDVQGAPLPSPLASSSSHQAHLRVWPSSRLFWPPPRSMRQRGSVGSPRFRVGIRRSTCVPGSWRPRFSQPARPGLGHRRPRRRRQSESRGGGGWPPSVSWRAAGHSRTVCRRRRSRDSGCTKEEGVAISGVVRGGRTSPTCGPCLRSRWQVFEGMPPFLEPVVKVQGSGRNASVATEGASRLAPPLGGDVGLQQRPRSGLVVAVPGAARRTWRGWASSFEP